MKKLIILFLVSIISCTVYSQAQIEFEKDIIDLGDFEFETKPLDCVIKFKNTGNSPLIINKAYAAWGGFIITPPERPILPQKEGIVKIHVDKRDGRIPGSFKRTVSLSTNVGNYKILIRGNYVGTEGRKDVESNMQSQIKGDLLRGWYVENKDKPTEFKYEKKTILNKELIICNSKDIVAICQKDGRKQIVNININKGVGQEILDYVIKFELSGVGEKNVYDEYLNNNYSIINKNNGRVKEKGEIYLSNGKIVSFDVIFQRHSVSICIPQNPEDINGFDILAIALTGIDYKTDLSKLVYDIQDMLSNDIIQIKAKNLIWDVHIPTAATLRPMLYQLSKMYKE